MAGRLRGSAFQLAVQLKVQRYEAPSHEPVEVTGDALLALPTAAAYVANNGQQIPEQQAGASLLLAALEREYLPRVQDMTIAALDPWEELTIPQGMSRADFLFLFRAAYAEANQRGGLVLNSTARSYQLFKKLGVSKQERRDILLKVDGDLSRFEPRSIVLLRLRR